MNGTLPAIDSNLIAVLPSHLAGELRASALAGRLQLPLLTVNPPLDALAQYALVLRVCESHIELQPTGRKASGPVSVDFGSGGMRHRRRGGANELLGKAVGVGKRPDLRVLDATAGLGRDAFVLADLGCRVALYERHPIVHELLRDGIDNARSAGDNWLAGVIAKMTLFNADSRTLSNEAINADVIYIDPMFPEREKQAAVKKEMAVMQLLLREQLERNDEEALLNWALASPVSRVVVKRPLKAEPLGNTAPSHCIRGRAVRYDTYVLRGL